MSSCYVFAGGWKTHSTSFLLAANSEVGKYRVAVVLVQLLLSWNRFPIRFLHQKCVGTQPQASSGSDLLSYSCLLISLTSAWTSVHAYVQTTIRMYCCSSTRKTLAITLTSGVSNLYDAPSLFSFAPSSKLRQTSLDGVEAVEVCAGVFTWSQCS